MYNVYRVTTAKQTCISPTDHKMDYRAILESICRRESAQTINREHTIQNFYAHHYLVVKFCCLGLLLNDMYDMLEINYLLTCGDV